MKKSGIIIMILIIILGAILGIYFYKNMQKNNLQNENTTKNMNTNINANKTANTSKNTTANTNTASNKTSNVISNTNENTTETDKIITKEEAEKILEKKYGTQDQMTGNTMSYGYLTTIKGNDGKRYYAFRESWLVDNSHLSFLQNVFVSLDGKTIKTVSTPEAYEENQVVTFDKETVE